MCLNIMLLILGSIAGAKQYRPCPPRHLEGGGRQPQRAPPFAPGPRRHRRPLCGLVVGRGGIAAALHFASEPSKGDHPVRAGRRARNG